MRSGGRIRGAWGLVGLGRRRPECLVLLASLPAPWTALGQAAPERPSGFGPGGWVGGAPPGTRLGSLS